MNILIFGVHWETCSNVVWVEVATRRLENVSGNFVASNLFIRPLSQFSGLFHNLHGTTPVEYTPLSTVALNGRDPVCWGMANGVFLPRLFLFYRRIEHIFAALLHRLLFFVYGNRVVWIQICCSFRIRVACRATFTLCCWKEIRWKKKPMAASVAKKYITSVHFYCSSFLHNLNPQPKELLKHR